MGMANMRIGHIEVTQPGSVPGLRSPGVGFEQPFEMLDACHDRVRRTLELMGKLQNHLQTQGCDDSARQAARDVLRYFDIAAPLHHQDEELHIFPALRERLAEDAPLLALVQRLEQDHREMDALWNTVVRVSLQALIDGSSPALSPEQKHALQVFRERYEQHLALEDEVAYPAARQVVGVSEQQVMGKEMAARRQR